MEEWNHQEPTKISLIRVGHNVSHDVQQKLIASRNHQGTCSGGFISMQTCTPGIAVQVFMLKDRARVRDELFTIENADATVVHHETLDLAPWPFRNWLTSE